MIRADKKGIFRFASLQSKAAADLLHQSPLSDQHLKSVVLYHNDRFYSHSDAVLKTAHLLGGAWRLLYAFWWVPRFIRDGIYDWVAANRYKWFGKKDQCMIPTPDLRSRFLD